MNLCIANYFCALKIVYPQIACGMDHTLLLSDEGEVFSCGWGADGQTGERAECICLGNWFYENWLITVSSLLIRGGRLFEAGYLLNFHHFFLVLTCLLHPTGCL